jgi:long-chain acyl-CoA synthetase
MSNVATHAESQPDKPAVIFGNGVSQLSYAQLEQNSRRLAALLRSAGVEPGSCVAALVGNDASLFEAYWAAMRLGTYFTPINWHLSLAEVQYVIDNSDATALITAGAFEKTGAALKGNIPKVKALFSVGGPIEGFRPLEDALADVPADVELPDQFEGATMLYSSGTTGFPKGVRGRISGLSAGDPSLNVIAKMALGMFGMTEEDRYLCPGPLYHAAPLVFTMLHQRLGATVVVMPRFDAEEALRIIQDQKVTTAQWVPTHFTRMLHLPEEVRKRYDVSSIRIALHAAAPCPIPIKRQMIEWWGPVVHEYYAGTEGGGTFIRAEEWLERPGSVGRHWSGGQVLILDDDGNAIDEPEVEGTVYFGAPEDPNARFAYHKDDEKTRGIYVGDAFTLGDIGYKDAEGYVFLTDRKTNMIISGGVNIYPQEVENRLQAHPGVSDCAVIGVPNEEFGEEVKAVVIPREGFAPGPALERELIDFCRDGIAHLKCPRSVDFAQELPRTPTGKLLKRKLRQQYWEGQDGVI